MNTEKEQARAVLIKGKAFGTNVRYQFILRFNGAIVLGISTRKSELKILKNLPGILIYNNMPYLPTQFPIFPQVFFFF